MSIVAEKKEKRYVSDNTQLMSEWNWEKNSILRLDPDRLTCGSGVKAWWKCDKGHEWISTIYNRSNGNRCPYCSGRYAIKGENDLQTVNPVLAKEWDHDKNGELKPENVTAYSGKKVWWKCSKGHEWQAVIASRNQGSSCPYCAGQKVLVGKNDLKSVNPVLANEWNYQKNNGLTPADVMSNSGKKVWWKCSKNHEWKASVAQRNNGRGCPYCTSKKVLIGYNDLQSTNPSLSTEWNYEKNVGLTPMNITANSHKKVWWKCDKGHEWQATVYHRNKDRGCPFCSLERNTSFPEYALVYYLEKYGINTNHSYKGNGYELDVFIPDKKTAIEYDGYYWHKNKTKQDLEKNKKCQADGIKLYRIREGLLPLNSNSTDYIIDKSQKDLPKVIKDILSEIIEQNIDIDFERDTIAIENLREHTEKENSILFSNPFLAKEWNYEKNENLKPEHFKANSSKKVWWVCSKGHEWQATIAHRNNGRGCPYCSNQKVLCGYNDLQTINPILAKDWNYKKNGKLTPLDVLPNSGKKVWWICSKGHEWQATINHRNHGRGCPQCAIEKRNKTK